MELLYNYKLDDAYRHKRIRHEMNYGEIARAHYDCGADILLEEEIKPLIGEKK